MADIRRQGDPNQVVFNEENTPALLGVLALEGPTRR